MRSQKNANSDDSILLYEQIKIGIKELIKSNNLKAGDKIPNESELGKIYNVSRITIRRAIKELVDEDIIEVIRGKGTFVKAAKKDIHLLNLNGFTDGLSTEENNIEKEILYRGMVSGKLDIPEVVSSKYYEFLKLVRVVKDAEGPLSVDFAYLPKKLYPDIETLISDSSSTFKIIRENYNIKFTRVEKEIEYIHPSSEICKHLGVNKLSIVILIKKIIYDSNNLPVHYSKYYLLGDRIKFYIDADYTE
ncbi:GntR family transcriptional regulator [Sporosarcina sp. NPDC096371]|uniref:GntR family transcriptional regulator n=1 Tax=Sporosarcina sp. NPDC096371 TaxID=3364530 RepID=UPI003811E32A